MSLAELEEQPRHRVCFDPRFVTPNYLPRIIEHAGISTRIHTTNSLPILLDAFFHYEMGKKPEGTASAYFEQIEQDHILLESLIALRSEEDLYEASAFSVYLHNQEEDERLRQLPGDEVVAHQGINPASPELRAQKDYNLSCIYVFLADRARQLDPAYNIDSLRN